MGDGAGGAGLFVPRRDVPEGEAQGDGVAGEDEEHGRARRKNYRKNENERETIKR